MTQEPSAGELARTDVPIARLDESLQDVRSRIGEWDTALVVNDERIVLGRLGRKALASKEDVSVEEAMRPGSGTVRPSIRASAALERMDRDNLRTLLVTTSDGRLVGVLYKEDVPTRP